MQTENNPTTPSKKIKASKTQSEIDASYEGFHLLDNAQIRELQDEQIVKLEKKQIMQLSAQQITMFTATQISVFSAEQISFLSQEQVAGKQYVGDYWTPEISLDEIGLSSNSRGLSAEHVIAMGDRVLCLGTIAISNLSTDATQALSPTYIAQFTAGQVRGLNTNILRANQVAAISAKSIIGLTPAQLINIGKLISNLSPDAIAVLTTPQITALTLAQASVLSIPQIKAFKKIQLAALSPQQIGIFSKAQVKALFKDDTISPQYLSICISMCFDFNPTHLSKEQILELGDNVQYLSANLIAKLSGEATQALQPQYIAKFTAEQVGALNTKALSADQISAIDSHAVGGLSPEQLRQMGVAVSYLSKEAIEALTIKQLAALSTDQMNILAHNEATQSLIFFTADKQFGTQSIDLNHWVSTNGKLIATQFYRPNIKPTITLDLTLTPNEHSNNPNVFPINPPPPNQGGEGKNNKEEIEQDPGTGTGIGTKPIQQTPEPNIPLAPEETFVENVPLIPSPLSSASPIGPIQYLTIKIQLSYPEQEAHHETKSLYLSYSLPLDNYDSVIRNSAAILALLSTTPDSSNMEDLTNKNSLQLTQEQLDLLLDNFKMDPSIITNTLADDAELTPMSGAAANKSLADFSSQQTIIRYNIQVTPNTNQKTPIDDANGIPQTGFVDNTITNNFTDVTSNTISQRQELPNLCLVTDFFYPQHELSKPILKNKFLSPQQESESTLVTELKNVQNTPTNEDSNPQPIPQAIGLISSMASALVSSFSETTTKDSYFQQDNFLVANIIK